MNLTKTIILILILFLYISTLSLNAQKVTKPEQVSGTVKIEDFNNGRAGRNLLDNDTGSFEAPRKYSGNSIKQSYSFLSDIDWAIRLDYDVSANSGSVGYWTRLTNLNMKDSFKESKLSFYIKGDTKKGFTSMLKIDLKAKMGNEVGSVIIGGITDTWQKKQIPLSRFTGVQTWEKLYELVFVFSGNDFGSDDSLKGTIYIDNIAIE